MAEAKAPGDLLRQDEPIGYADHFDSLETAQRSSMFGMWLFLGSEVLLFTAMFGLYTGYRLHYPEAFEEGIGHNLRWAGSLNTLILLVSSYFIARSIPAVQQRRQRTAVRLMLGTVVLGLLFLVFKGIEYAQHFGEGIVPAGRSHFFVEHATVGLPMFFNLYYLMTGAHAIHVTVGLGVILWLAAKTHRTKNLEAVSHPLEIGAMYWHLVDIVWIFLWPLYYLAGGHRG